MELILNRIKELIEYLNHYTKSYDEGHPEISDAEWDKMYFELQSLENKYSIYLENSPTQKVIYQQTVLELNNRTLDNCLFSLIIIPTKIYYKEGENLVNEKEIYLFFYCNARTLLRN